MFDRSKYLAFDVETSGELPEYALQAYRHWSGQAWVTSAALAQWHGDEIHTRAKNMPESQHLRALLQQAITHKLTVVCWNAPFDISWLIAYGLYDEVMQVKWMDAMQLWKHFDVTPEYDTDSHKKKHYGLKEAVREFLPQYAGYEDDIDFHSTDPEQVSKRLQYNKDDVHHTLLLAEIFYNKLTDRQRRVADIEARANALVGRANLDGLVIHVPNTYALQARLADDGRTAMEALAEFGVTKTIISSPKKLATLLFDDWGLPVQKITTGEKSGAQSRSTDKETLHELALIDPRAKIVRTARESANNNTKFVEATLKALEYNEDGRVRPAAKIFGTYTGRMTYASKQGRNKDERQTGIALAQWKRGSDFRKLITVPKGFVLCETDAASQEFKLMACASGDEQMLSLCLPGEDAHAYMAASIAGKDYRTVQRLAAEDDPLAKSERLLGKVANLSCQYRTSAKKLRSVARVQYNVPMEQPEADLIHGMYRRTYTGVPQYWDRQIRTCRAQGYAETFAGRRVRLEGNWFGNNGWSLEGSAINFPIQGTGADMKYLALAVVKPYLMRHGCYFYYELHDGLFWLLPEDNWKTHALNIQQILNALPYEKAWGWTPPVPMTWDLKAGPTWGELKGVEP